MRMTKYSSLYAAAMILAMGAGLDVAGPPLRSSGSGNNRRPTPPKMDTPLQREIAEWNAAVERRREERRHRRSARQA
jgi:hypothetical protein